MAHIQCSFIAGQASDVAHTMQHWHVYREWNERLFVEMYCAYKAGRAKKNPAEYWYEGELGFFDFYIIPLARKLKECGVFGVASDEYLTWAQNNRKEWEDRGEAILKEMINSVGIQDEQTREQNDDHTRAETTCPTSFSDEDEPVITDEVYV